jgi:Ca-activated chloride channel family protein
MMNEKNLISLIHFSALKGMAVRAVFCAVVFLSLVIPRRLDGFIVLPEPVPVLRTPFPLEVSSHIVDVSIDGLSAETLIDQVFYNPTSYRLEGYYIFPVPKNALIRKFTMEIDGKETEAELLDAAKARSIYEDIVRRQLDPALLEYSDRSMFKVRIFPIEPRSKKRIRIKYQETLSIESGSIEYLYRSIRKSFHPEISRRCVCGEYQIRFRDRRSVLPDSSRGDHA